MTRVRAYRERAAKYRHLSVVGTTAELRSHYLGLAEIMDRLAEEHLTLAVLPGPGPRTFGQAPFHRVSQRP